MSREPGDAVVVLMRDPQRAHGWRSWVPAVVERVLPSGRVAVHVAVAGHRYRVVLAADIVLDAGKPTPATYRLGHPAGIPIPA